MSGAAFGPTIVGLIYDTSQSYRMAFTIFSAMSLVATPVIFFARPSNPETKTSHQGSAFKKPV
jgi:cyanate permease